jgi:hypothetical protein
MYVQELAINTPVTLIAQGPSSGLSNPSDLVLLFNGTVSSTVPTFAAITGNLYSFTFTPTVTGQYVLYCFGTIQAVVNCVTQTLYNITGNIQDEALGSWQWDKVAGTLLMLRQDGTTLAQFTVIDNLTASSRELVS